MMSIDVKTNYWMKKATSIEASMRLFIFNALIKNKFFNKSSNLIKKPTIINNNNLYFISFYKKIRYQAMINEKLSNLKINTIVR